MFRMNSKLDWQGGENSTFQGYFEKSKLIENSGKYQLTYIMENSRNSWVN